MWDDEVIVGLVLISSVVAGISSVMDRVEQTSLAGTEEHLIDCCYQSIPNIQVLGSRITDA